jgi:hypothetical protein
METRNVPDDPHQTLDQANQNCSASAHVILEHSSRRHNENDNNQDKSLHFGDANKIVWDMKWKEEEEGNEDVG